MTGDEPGRVLSPIGPQTLPEAAHLRRELLLLLDPRRHDLLPLDDPVHEVLGGVDEGAVGVVVRLRVLAFAAGDVPELAPRHGVLDALVRERLQALDGHGEGAGSRFEPRAEFLAHRFAFLVGEARALAQGVGGRALARVGETLAGGFLGFRGGFEVDGLRDLVGYAHGFLGVVEHAEGCVL